MVDRGDLAGLRALIDEHPEVAAAGYVSHDPPSDEYHLLTHLVSWPAGRPNGAAVAHLLLDRGADPNTRYNGTETALHWAASSPADTAVVDELVTAGADLDAGGGVIRGGTPLMNAVHFGFFDVATQLARLGASLHNMIAAAGLGRIDLLDGWDLGDGRFRADATRVTPDAAADADVVDGALVESWMFGAVIAALTCSQFHVVDWFIERGFDLDHIPESEEWGCLHHAAYRGSVPMAMFLISRGADLEVMTSYQARPTGFACAHGNAEVMNHLIDRGAEVTVTEAAYYGRLDKLIETGGRHDDTPRLLATMVGTTTVIGKPLARTVAEGRLAAARFILQRDPRLVHELVDGTSLLALAADAGDDAMLAVFEAAAASG